MTKIKIMKPFKRERPLYCFMTLVFECKFYHLLNVKSEMIIAMIMMPWSVP